MRLRFRLLRVILAALFRSRDLDFSEESVLHFTVLPQDCVLKHVGNDRYHAFMDLGRIDLLIRFGGWKAVIFEKLQPFVFTAHIRHRYPLRLFQTFVLRTRLVNMDNRFFWLEHVFECDKRAIATAISKNGFKCRDKIVSTRNTRLLLNRENIYWHYCDRKSTVLSNTEKLLRALQRG
jgi:acyl-CoA thioesterase FadM